MSGFRCDKTLYLLNVFQCQQRRRSDKAVVEPGAFLDACATVVEPLSFGVAAYSE